MASTSNLQINALGAGYPISGPAFTNQTFSASTTKIGVVFQASSAEAITKFLFRYGARTGTPPTYICGLQGVAADGTPDGTYKGGGSPASKTFTPPADATWDATVQEQTLANSYTPAAGDMLAWVIEYSSGTIDGSNNSSFTTNVTNLAGGNRQGTPYPLTNTGSWAKATVNHPVFGYRGASNTYGFPLKAQSATAVTSNGNRAAMLFSLPAGAGTSVQVVGLRLNITTPAAGAQNWIVGIWDAAGAVVETITLDSDYCSINNSSTREVEVWFDTPPTLTVGTTYYLGVERSGTNLSLSTYDFQDAGALSALAGGSGYYLATWNGSVWATTTTSRPMVELILSDMTASAGGSRAVIVGG